MDNNHTTILNFQDKDPFKLGDESNNDIGNIVDNDKHIHIHIHQRNSRKYITSIQGLPDVLDLKDLKRILKTLNKKLCCNGSLKKDSVTNTNILQLQGDHRQACATFLIEQDICTKESIVVHGA